MIKLTSTIVLSLPLLASALPHPIIEIDSRDRLDDLNARGFWKTVKNDAKKVGHDVSKAANSPVGQIAEKAALTALIARDAELYDELVARGFWNTVKKDAKKVGHDVSKAANSPVGQIAEKAALTALFVRNPELYDELDARGFWQTVKKDAKKVGHDVSKVANSPVGQIAEKAALTALIVRNPELYDEIVARGFWQTVKKDAKKVGHDLSKAANSPVGQIALTSLVARDPELYDELYARGFWQTVKNDAKKVGHKVENAVNSPVGQVVTQVGLTAAKLVKRDIELDEIDARNYDLEDRFFDDEFDEMYERDFEIDELD
jgi:uncharacterized protein YceH (UPF0502 family)